MAPSFSLASRIIPDLRGGFRNGSFVRLRRRRWFGASLQLIPAELLPVVQALPQAPVEKG